VADQPAFFDGIAGSELEELLAKLPRRNFPVGSVLVAEGDSPREMYVTQSGWADVHVADRHGGEHRVGRIAPGTAIGEMSILTGQPAAATVRASEDLEVLVLSRCELERVTERFPQIYRNLSAVLAERLAQTNRVSLRDSRGRLTLLHDACAPPLLGYALACSVAWHTRSSTLLVVLGQEVHADLAALATMPPDLVAARSARRRGGAELMVAAPEGAFDDARLGETIDDLLTSFDYELLQSRTSDELTGATRTLTLAGAESGDVPITETTVVRAWTRANGRPVVAPGSAVSVPELGPADEDPMREGLLPAGTPAGTAIGLVARDLTGLTVGLALGAGSIRGYAHCGVLRALERNGLVPDYLAGTSVGGCVAAMYAAGFTPDECADLLDRGGALLLRPALPTRSLLSSRSFRRFVRALGPEVQFDDLELPLAIVTADLTSGREVVLRRGVVWQAVVATMSIPGIFPAHRIGPYTLVDGGILNPVPTNVTEKMGARAVIGVRLFSQPADPDWELESVVSAGRTPSPLTVIMRSIEIMQSRVDAEPTAATRVMIHPRYSGLSEAKLRKFNTGRRFVEDGEAAVEAALPRLWSAFPWLAPMP
jgi:NTE family protein